VKLKIDPIKAIFCIFIISLGSLAYAKDRVKIRAKNATPIYASSQNPFGQIFGLPKSEAGTITPKDKLDAGFLYYVTNNAIKDELSNGESVIWDGETAQFNVRLRYGFSDKLELGVDIPFVENSGGYLDAVIRRTHKILGFPNDRQNQFEINQIHYQLKENDRTFFEMQEKQNGLGDVRFSAAVPLFTQSLHPQQFLAFRTLLKLPTGDAKYLLGSGGTDLSMGLALSDYKTLKGINTVLTTNFGMIYMGNTKVLREKQRHFAGYGGLSLDWLALKNLELKLQLDVNSALFKSELKQLGNSIQLLVGGTIHLPGEAFLDLGMSQNMATNSTPDVGFYLLIRRLY